MRKKKNNAKWNRTIALLLSGMLVLGSTPVSALAAGVDEPEIQVEETEQVEEISVGEEEEQDVLGDQEASVGQDTSETQHTHTWTYEVQGNNLLAMCRTEDVKCPDYPKGVPLSLEAEDMVLSEDAENAEYSGACVKANGEELSLDGTRLGEKLGITYELQYYQGETLLETVRMEPGQYSVKALFGDKELTANFEITTHKHTWNYAKDDENDCVTASCKCGKSYTVLLTAENLEYTGLPYAGAKVVDSDENIFKGNVNIAYTLRDAEGEITLSGAPTAIGTYTVTASLGEDGNVILTKDFNITHGHEWTYTRKEGSDKVLAICNHGTCPDYPKGITLSMAAADADYSQNAYKGVTVEANGEVLTQDGNRLGENIKITWQPTYYGVENSAKVEGALNAGKYRAEIKFGNQVLSDTFEIRKIKQNKVTVKMNSYDLACKTATVPEVSGNLNENAKVTYYYSTKNQNTGGTQWTKSSAVKAGTYYMYATVADTTNYQGYTTATQKFVVHTDHKWLNTEKKALSTTKETTVKQECSYCGETRTVKLPKKTVSVTMGKSSKLISDNTGCTFKLTKSASTYSKYFTMTSAGTVKTTTNPANYKYILSSKTIPVKVVCGGEEYDMNVKLVIPAPSVAITAKSIKIGGVSGYKFMFTYNIKGADKVYVSLEKGTTTSIKNDLNRYISSPKSNSNSYINLSSNFLKKTLNNKITFKVRARYGNNYSEYYTKTITVK